MIKFYEEKGKFFVLINDNKVELDRVLYMEYKLLCEKEIYNDRKYKEHTSSYDYIFSNDDTFAASNIYSYKVSKNLPSLEQQVIQKEHIKEIFKDIKDDRISYMLKKHYEGYYNYEIAQELGVRHETVSLWKKKVRKQFNTDSSAGNAE